jgi:hypothetical protein
MKLTKSKLIKFTNDHLKNFGYKEIKDTITPAQGLYIKPIKNGLYFLTLGLTISKYYTDLFTASFYLSKTTTWATFGGDIPNASYRRIGSFLTKEERKVLLEGEYSLQESGDAWWNAGNVDGFIETVKIAETRFLNQLNLFDMINDSILINELSELASLTIDMINNGYWGDYNYRFVPDKPIDDIPIEWFKVAERIIVERNAILNNNTVKRLAADAYRQSKYK